MNALLFVLDRVRQHWTAVIYAGQRGQTMAEYGILIAVIAVVVVVAATLLGSNMSSLFKSVAGKL